MTFAFRFFLLIIVASFCFPNLCNAQDTVLNVSYKGKLDSLNSQILHQKRFIQVFVPSGYKPGSADKYDVLYVLDGGNWNTGLIAQTQRFVEGQGYMPPTLIVSIMGINREKELTPTPLESWKGSGGAADFLGFIKNELIPYINKTYPSNGSNTLWGHSLSGMFAVYFMLNEPTAFKSIIAADPSLWWDNGYVTKMAIDKLPAFDNLETTLFISGREGPDFHGMNLDSMESILKRKAPKKLNWKTVAYADETHSSLRLKTTYDGLKFTYAGHTAGIEFGPMNGIVLKDKPIKIWYFDDTTRTHYTLDGTIPTRMSSKVEREIKLTGPGKITYRRFTNRSTYDKIATGNFTAEKMPSPVSKRKNFKPGGFTYSYYEGDWEQWPDIKNLKPVKTGITNRDFDPDNLPRKNNFALVIDGYMESKEEGYYIFFLQADKNSRLYLGDKLLMEWSGNYNRLSDSYIVPLSKGFYHFRIEYLHKIEYFKLRWAYLTPSTMETKDTAPIPFDLQYSTKE